MTMMNAALHENVYTKFGNDGVVDTGWREDVQLHPHIQVLPEDITLVGGNAI